MYDTQVDIVSLYGKLFLHCVNISPLWTRKSLQMNFAPEFGAKRSNMPIQEVTVKN